MASDPLYPPSPAERAPPAAVSSEHTGPLPSTMNTENHHRSLLASPDLSPTARLLAHKTTVLHSEMVCTSTLPHSLQTWVQLPQLLRTSSCGSPRGLSEPQRLGRGLPYAPTGSLAPGKHYACHLTPKSCELAMSVTSALQSLVGSHLECVCSSFGSQRFWCTIAAEVCG